MKPMSALGDNTIQNVTIYDVLDEIARILYNSYSGDYIIRGSYAVRNYLLNLRHSELVRITSDIDLYWITRTTLKKLADEFHIILNENTKLGLHYEKESERGRHNGFQTGRLNYHVTGENVDYHVNIDLHYLSSLNLNRDIVDKENTLYVSPASVIADKVAVAASDDIVDRVHDLYDIYVLSSYFDFYLNQVSELCKSRILNLAKPVFIFKPDIFGILEQKFNTDTRLNNTPVGFDLIFNRVIEYSTEIYTFIFNGGKNKCWLSDKSRWLEC